MAENNPQSLALTLRSTMIRYLLTTLPVSHNYPLLREEYRKIIEDHTLVTGPFVEALPDFEKGGTLRSLLRSSGGPLHDGLSQLPSALLDRPLHGHQHKAIIECCEYRKSLLVATGTGSGKTECFLYPLAHRLLDDPDPKARGVRCLLIYPMNALANDQLLYRIAPLFGRHLASFGITFGRFTSQIRANRSREEEEDVLRENRRLMKDALGGGGIPRNWLLTREEMLANPPMILITNYAMLEHLLLLPRNAPLFAQNQLECIVLDEIHTYAGAQATEVAYLLRKLKNRLKVEKPLQVFGTSASFPSGGNTDERIKRFASNLLGESVDVVLRGKRIPHLKLSAPATSPFSLDSATWRGVGSILQRLEGEQSLTISAWKSAVDAAGLPEKLANLAGPSLESALADAFCENSEIRRVSQELQGSPICEFRELAQHAFPNCDSSEQVEALDAVIRLGMIARSSSEGFPLLPSRYHIAANCPDGISAKLTESGQEGWSALYPLRRYQDGEVPYYSLLVCRRCGQPYIEGFESAGYLLPRRPQNVSAQTRRVFWLGTPVHARLLDEADSEEGESAEWKEEIITVDPENGRLGALGGVRLTKVDFQRDEDSPSPIVRKCPACGSQAPGAETEVITPIHPGNEALGAVVVQKVMEALPERPQKAEHFPWNGRKLLAFSDNRQNAAFFAPYFERTSFDLALRSAACRAVQASHLPLDFETVTKDVYDSWEASGGAFLIDGDGELVRGWPKIRHLLMGRIAAEFCTPGGRRSSLEALGAVRIDYDASVLARLSQYVRGELPMLATSDAEAMVRFLLESMRREKALTGLSKVDMTSPWIWSRIYAGKRSFSLHPGGDATHAWLTQEGSNRKNRRLDYLTRLAGIGDSQARSFLHGVWQEMQDAGIRIAQQGGSLLDARMILLGDGRNHALHRCVTCGLRQHDVVQNLCTAFKCTGRTVALTADEVQELWRDNHYLRTYDEGSAHVVHAREHSASLSTELRGRIENDFGEGRINLLSCTTTMELGVDLGELEATVNLNLPPGIANYQQRSGRAGRRAQAAPFSVTVARNAPYDQAIYREFKSYLAKDAPIPFVRLDNPSLLQRHQNAIILSHFLRGRIHDLNRNAPMLKDLFGEDLSDASQKEFRGARDSWIESTAGQDALAEAERLLKQPGLSSGRGLAGEALRQYFRTELDRLLDEVAGRWTTYTEEIAKIKGDQEKDLRKKLHWTNLRNTFLRQLLVDFLSRHGMIPSYSFPVHSLSLEVVTEAKSESGGFNDSDVILTRDASLGISEYAPGAEVVANGRIWTSRGLTRSPRQFMPREWYIACPACHHVDVDITSDGLPAACGNCGTTEKRLRREFLSPTGFVTSYGERTGQDPGQTRRKERPADEARLLTIPRDEQFGPSDHSLIRTTLLRAKADEDRGGRLFIVNRGPRGYGYMICPLCHAADAAEGLSGKKWAHSNPLNGESCRYSNAIRPSDLVHRFDTDVLVLRINQPLPLAIEKGEGLLYFTECCARTLAEALRYGAADQLEIQPQELRASYRMRGAALDVILFDAASGGAGYCAELACSSVTDLLKRAASKLNCRSACATACTACLCDYSNQNAWDQFLRKPVLRWLEELLSAESPTLFSEIGAIPWANPSMFSLTAELAEAPEVHLFAPVLDNDAADIKPDEGTLGWMLGLLNVGKKVYMHMGQDLCCKGNASASLRRALRHFEPWVADGRLCIGHVKTEQNVISSIPRVFFEGGSQKAWFTLDPLTPLLDSVLPQPAFWLRGAPTKEQIMMTSQTRWFSTEELRPALPVERFPFEAGQVRDLRNVFHVLSDAYVERLTIHDPYCASHAGKLAVLLDALRGIVKEIERIEVRCRELPSEDRRYQSPAVMKSQLETALARFATRTPEIAVAPQFQNRQSHDRWLQFKVIEGRAGASRTHRFDLTGGIDYLMDQRSATTVYRYEVS